MRKIKTVVLCVFRWQGVLGQRSVLCAEGVEYLSVPTKNLTDPYSYTDGGNISYYFE